jgi:hypothetical protein
MIRRRWPRQPARPDRRHADAHVPTAPGPQLPIRFPSCRQRAPVTITDPSDG